jgi:L-fucose isomerase-like protein
MVRDVLDMESLKLGLVHTGIAALDIKYAEDCRDSLLKNLRQLGHEIVAHDRIVVDSSEALSAAERMRRADVDLLVVLVGTFTQDPVMTNLIQNVRVPVVLWAVPEVALRRPPGGPSESGGLVGVIMNASALSKMGMRFKVIFGEPADQEAFGRLRNTIEAVRVLKALRTSRVGLVGYHSPGFYDGSVDEVALKQHVGTELVHIDLSELNTAMQKIAESDAKKTHEELSNRIVDLTLEERIRDGRIFLGLKQLVESNKLDAVAVKCWPELSFSSCFALSRLSDAGIPGGCEGDVNATVTMLMLQRLTGQSIFLCDVFHLDEKKNTILTYHCGASGASLAPTKGDVIIRKHPLGCGATVEFPIKSGRVTIARLGNLAGKYRMFISSGEALPTEQIVRGNPLEVRLDAGVGEFLDTVTSKGIEHHLLIVHGDWSETLQEICDIAGFQKIVV